MYHYGNKQSHDAYEKSKKTINSADTVVMADSSYYALGFEGSDRFDLNIIPLLDYHGLSIFLPRTEELRLKDLQSSGDLKAQRARVQSMRWYKNHQAEFFQDDDNSIIEDGNVLTFVARKRQEGNRVLVITQSEELARTLLLWNHDETLPPVIVKQISQYGYLKNLQAYYDDVNERKSQATQNELDELACFDPLVTN